VPESADFKQCLLALIELLLIEAKQRQKNPALYDSLYQGGTLWYYYNRDRLPNEVVQEIDYYLAYDGFYLNPEETQKKKKKSLKKSLRTQKSKRKKLSATCLNDLQTVFGNTLKNFAVNLGKSNATSDEKQKPSHGSDGFDPQQLNQTAA
jgi:hypothetical protein